MGRSLRGLWIVDAGASQRIMRRMAVRSRSVLKTIRVLVALGCNTVIAAACARGADLDRVDPSFVSGLSALRKTTGIVEDFAATNHVEWAPDLQLLIGVKAVEGAKQTIYFVELTTIPCSLSKVVESSWPRVWHTNRFNLPAPSTGTNMTFEFAYRLAPVRVRVFDAAGKPMVQGETVVPWELMTNSLAEVCRLSLGLQRLNAIPPENVTQRKEVLQALLGQSNLESIDWAKLMRPVASGFLSLGGLFAESISTPALNDICEKARCAIHLPVAKVLFATAFGAKLDLTLDPRFLENVSKINAGKSAKAEVQYSFPADLKSSTKKLVSVEFIVGSPHGAEVMLGGIQSIRAVHPNKPNREFLAQVLVGGRARTKPLETLQ